MSRDWAPMLGKQRRTIAALQELLESMGIFRTIDVTWEQYGPCKCCRIWLELVPDLEEGE